MKPRSRLNTVIFTLLGVLFLLGCTRSWGNRPVTQATATPAAVREPTQLGSNANHPSPTPFQSEPLTPTPTITMTPTMTPTPTPAVYGPTGFPDNVDPLTGLVVDNPDLLERRPVMVKVSNFPRGLRPHSGLSFADLVFEYYIGAGATRFTTIFYGQDSEKVGPVRSARLIDASLGNLYQTVFAFVSADPFVFNRIVTALGDRAITESARTCPALCRTGNGDVNSVFTNTGLFSQYAEQEKGVVNSRPNLEGTLFDPAPPAGGQSGIDLLVQFSFFARSGWRFDPATTTYLRWIEAVDKNQDVEMVPLTDRLTDKQLGFSNVVVLFVQYNELKPTLHEVMISSNTTGWRAIVFRDGKAYDVTWKSAGGDNPIRFFDADGQPFAFKPGNTWFEVVGLGSQVETPNPGEWKVTFFLP